LTIHTSPISTTIHSTAWIPGCIRNIGSVHHIHEYMIKCMMLLVYTRVWTRQYIYTNWQYVELCLTIPEWSLLFQQKKKTNNELYILSETVWICTRHLNNTKQVRACTYSSQRGIHDGICTFKLATAPLSILILTCNK
jgi:hypothetical protein